MTKMNLATKQKQAHGRRDEACACPGGGAGGATQRVLTHTSTAIVRREYR